MECIAEIEGELIRVVSPAPNIKESIHKFFNLKLFGSFEQMRVEMELRYKAQSVFLTTQDKTKLHGYWVPCAATVREQQEIMESELSNFQELHHPTMIFCNPNAGFAEYFQYQSDWLDYYIHQGINVFVWNYRGFGLSEGTPTPKVIISNSCKSFINRNLEKTQRS